MKKKQLKFSELLKLWRHSKKISQEQAAGLLARSIRTYQGYEQGREPRGAAKTAILKQLSK